MDASQRAEKILDEVLREQEPSTAMVEWVVAQIREAENKAYTDGKLEGVGAGTQEGFKQGRASMREEAAKVVEEWRCNDKGDKCYPCDCGNEVPQDAIAERIRALGSEEKMIEEREICPSCHGAGGYNIGDCENGIWETCPECDGLGEIQ